MFRNIVLTGSLLVGGFLAGAGPVAAESIDYLFNIKLGIAKIGEMRITGREDGKTYETTGELHTTGLAGAVYDLKYTYTAKGDASNHWHLLPALYTAKIHEKSDNRAVEIRYSGNRVVSVTTQPPTPQPANMASQRNTVDPMTLIYMLIRPVAPENVCAGKYALYDGNTHFTVTYVNPHKYSDGRVVCGVDYAGGNGNSGVSVSGITFKPGADGRMYISDFTVQTNAGALKATRR